LFGNQKQQSPPLGSSLPWALKCLVTGRSILCSWEDYKKNKISEDSYLTNSPRKLHCCYVSFHCSYLYNYYNYSWTLSIKFEFQHFIPRFKKKIPSHFWIPLKEGFGCERKAWRQGEDWLTFRIYFC
jgi:hypothetical protein